MSLGTGTVHPVSAASTDQDVTTSAAILVVEVVATDEDVMTVVSVRPVVAVSRHG